MKLNDKCCDALGCRNEIQTELKRLYEYEAFARIVHEYIHGNDLLQPDLTTLLTAVRGLISPEWISADLVRPTEPGWYWVLMGYDMMNPIIVSYDGEQQFFQDWKSYTVPFTYTRYIKINQPVVK